MRWLCVQVCTKLIVQLGEAAAPTMAVGMTKSGACTCIWLRAWSIIFVHSAVKLVVKS